MDVLNTAEYLRLQEGKEKKVPPWQKWGPYVTDRAWGTVREDYSKDGSAWEYFPYEKAMYRTFRWGEDGIAGFCDRYQQLVLSHSFWNGKDPYLKERLYGLATFEGNHGEDVKEYYYHLDATPSHSYLKFLYKYPQQEFPYEKLKKENANRSTDDLEYELIDTGIFDEDRYFDIFIEYAKAGPDDLCVKIEACNRGPEDAPLHIIPQLIFRNQWSWGEERQQEPEIRLGKSTDNCLSVTADDSGMNISKMLMSKYSLNKKYLYGSANGKVLFTNNETNKEVVFNKPNETPYTKDAFHDQVVNKKQSTNPENKGTKAGLHYEFEKVPSKQSVVVYLRLTNQELRDPLSDIESVFEQRKKEADDFYNAIHPKTASEEEKLIQRQAFAGMIWSKQIYLYDVGTWLEGDNPKSPPPKERQQVRNNHWRHLNSMRIFSMPDKWEYPWFAAWDLAFQCTTFAFIDPEFAKEQLWILLFDQFQHPNGQIPAYEWNFSDVNPPVQAWAVLKIFKTEQKYYGNSDYQFLEKCFHKLLLNFAWWVNKIDSEGNNIFEGGFLGLDNIAIIDRSIKLPKGELLDQADGSGWMAMFCLNLMRIALVLSEQNAIYESLATKFFEHYVYIAAALRKGYWRNYDMWDSQDHFFYSVIRYPDGSHKPIKVKSLVGIIPFYAIELLKESEIRKFKEFHSNFHWFCENRTHLMDRSVKTVEMDGEQYHLFSLISPDEMEGFLANVWNPEEFRSEYGLRSVSKMYDHKPFEFGEHRIEYEPGESIVRIKGGNSNWRGPIWFPTTYLVIESLHKLAQSIDTDIQVHVKGEDPITPSKMAEGLAFRLISLFEKDKKGVRPIYSNWKKFNEDANFSEHILFFEHYHGDTGRGLGASHQTGWSGLVANLIAEYRK